MLQKIGLLIILAFTIVSCQFTETMVLNEDGSGRMTLEMNMNEMMAFGGMVEDTAVVKVDSIISMREVLEEKKDSISNLSAEDQEKLKKMENYMIHMKMDSEAEVMIINMYTDFKDVGEANDLMSGLEQTDGLMESIGITSEGDGGEDGEESSSSITGVSYTYKKGKFVRDSFIKDKEEHKKQIDSIQSAEAFMSSMTYKLKYTFPRKIKKASVEDATYSLDGKTIEVERKFIDYLKNPDVLDLEIELEN